MHAGTDEYREQQRPDPCDSTDASPVPNNHRPNTNDAASSGRGSHLFIAATAQ